LGTKDAEMTVTGISKKCGWLTHIPITYASISNQAYVKMSLNNPCINWLDSIWYQATKARLCAYPTYLCVDGRQHKSPKHERAYQAGYESSLCATTAYKQWMSVQFPRLLKVK